MEKNIGIGNIVVCYDCQRVATGGILRARPDIARKMAQRHIESAGHRTATAYHIENEGDLHVIMAGILGFIVGTQIEG